MSVCRFVNLVTHARRVGAADCARRVPPSLTASAELNLLTVAREKLIVKASVFLSAPRILVAREVVRLRVPVTDVSVTRDMKRMAGLVQM